MKRACLLFLVLSITVLLGTHVTKVTIDGLELTPAATQLDLTLTNPTLGFTDDASSCFPRRPTVTKVSNLNRKNEAKGKSGDEITLSGTNLQCINEVRFGSTKATIVTGSQADGVISVTAPAGSGTVSVRVLSKTMVQGNRLSNAADFAGQSPKARFEYVSK